MNGRSASLSEKIARLRRIFIQQLPDRVGEARTLFASLRAGTADSETAGALHRCLHNIKGTSGSFGLFDLSSLSGQGEDQAKAILENPDTLTGENGQRLDACIADLQQLLEHLILPGADPDARTEKKPSAEATAPQATKDDAADRRLIYICDDEPLLTQKLSVQLHCFGYQTEVFDNTAALRVAILRKLPDAVIMDIIFPEGHSDGTHVLTELREGHGVQVPAVFISSRRDFDARMSAIQAGGEAYFPKPVPALDLVAALNLLTRQNQPEPFRVLIIDDEPEVAQYHALILENAGMVTRISAEPETVLDVVGDFRPDLVLMDMYMPRCSGSDLAKMIRQVPDYVSLPIVFLSSETDRKKQFSAMRVGAEGFLTKPIEPDYLVTSVALRAERMRTLRSLMMRDSLTGLFNHTSITQFLENALIAARREGHPVCFAMIDVDRFKSVNDSYGHPVGDQVLLALAQLLQQGLRQADLVGRYGGEEFAVILHDVSLEKAEQIMQQLRGEFSRVLFQAENVDFSCTFSCGVAAFPQLENMASLREAADKAMYQAKHAGRNRVMIHAS